MKKTLVSALMVGAISVAAISPTATAAENKKQLNPWHDCGIGAMIFKDNGTAAAISNIIWDLGTTAVTSNVSSQNSCEGAGAKTAMFINATLPKLEQDIASGEGEYISAMLELRGCEATSHQAIIKAVREDYANTPSKNAEELFNTVEKHVKKSFAQSCASA
jgi:hypothetical protein